MNVLTKNIHRISIIKPEPHPVLIIDTDAPVTRPVVFELFKVVSWTPQVIETDRRIQHIQLAPHDRPKTLVNL